MTTNYVFVARRDALKAALAKVMRVVDKKTTVPILSMVELNSDKGGVYVAGTDLDIFVKAYVKDAACHGPIIVNGDELMATASRCFGETIRVEQGTGETKAFVRIECAPLDGHIESVGNDEGIPRMTGTELPGSIVFDAVSLVSAIREVSPAISKEETRYYLNGINFSDDPTGAVLVTTDGHRLIHLVAAGKRSKAFTFGESGEKTIGGVILPRKVAETLVATAGDNKGDIRIKLLSPAESKSKGATKVVISFKLEEPVEITAKLIDGTFPDYRRVIPEEKKMKKLVFDSALVDRVMNSLPPAKSHKHGAAVKFATAGKAIKLSTSVDGTRTMTATAENAIRSGKIAAEVGINRTYLAMALRFVHGDADLLTLDAASPMILRTKGETNRFVVLMPMRV